MYYDTKKIGKRIQGLRRDKKMTQDILAEELGITTQHLGKIECGMRGTSVDLLADMSEYFDVSADYILFGKEDRSSELKNKLHSVATQLIEIERMI